MNILVIDNIDNNNNDEYNVNEDIINFMLEEIGIEDDDIEKVNKFINNNNNELILNYDDFNVILIK